MIMDYPAGLSAYSTKIQTPEDAVREIFVVVN